MSYTNSKLVSYTAISPNRSSPRNHEIDTITIHCMAGNCTVEQCGAIFAPPSRQASSNYGIGSDGRIALYCPESDRSWCTSSAANDNRAVTIEVANDGGAETGWHVSEKAYAALIDLVTDICKRNGIRRLLWKADKSLIGRVGEQNMTVHRWFAAKSCPGDYLYNLHYQIAAEVNKRIGILASAVVYKVQVGVFAVKANAVNYSKRVKAAGFDNYLDASSGRYVVYAGVFSKKENATARAAALAKKGIQSHIVECMTL